MITFIIVLHTLICILLSLVILMQSGRGGGLTETFASAESVFGAKTNSFMVRTTTVLASMFLVTCLTLAYLSSRKEHSLMSESSLIKKESTPQPKGIPVENSQSLPQTPSSSNGLEQSRGMNPSQNENTKEREDVKQAQPAAVEPSSAVGTNSVK